MKAAVAYDAGSPLVIEDLPTPGVGPRDVVVRIAASGICRTDLSAMRDPGRARPFVPGHESCGTVEAVGPEVRRVKAGDRVLASVSPVCGTCWWCVNGVWSHCDRNAVRSAPRFTLPDGRRAPALCGLGSFAEAMVVDEAAVVATHTDLPAEQLALLGCGVMTGLGAAFNTARVEAGSSVAVIGCGGVGQAVVQGARIAGAATIIAIDLSAHRRQVAVSVGATHEVDPAGGDPVEQVRALTAGRGADHAFEVVGPPQLMAQAFDMARAGGSVTLVGMPAADAVLTLPAMAVFGSGKRVQSSLAGGGSMLRDLPRYIRLAETGRLDLPAMVTRRITLDEINDGIAMLDRTEGVRTVMGMR